VASLIFQVGLSAVTWRGHCLPVPLENVHGFESGPHLATPSAGYGNPTIDERTHHVVEDAPTLDATAMLSAVLNKDQPTLVEMQRPKHAVANIVSIGGSLISEHSSLDHFPHLWTQHCCCARSLACDLDLY